jgi:hypothetical protein
MILLYVKRAAAAENVKAIKLWALFRQKWRRVESQQEPQRLAPTFSHSNAFKAIG